MNKKTTQIAVETVAAPAEHPMKKSYRFVSSKNIDFENLNAIESVAMSLALILAVTSGTLLSIS